MCQNFQPMKAAAIGSATIHARSVVYLIVISTSLTIATAASRRWTSSAPNMNSPKTKCVAARKYG